MLPLSVIMPVYNGERFLREAIESVLSQTFSDFEFIIIDDGSTDASLSVIKEYAIKDSRIAIISRSNRGLIASLNEGVESAVGKYIARMDADDVCLPTRFEKQMSLLSEKEIDICGCHYYLINADGHYIDSAIVPLDKRSFPVFLCYTTPFAHGSIMCKASVFAEGVRYGMTEHCSAEDYALWSYLYKKGMTFGNVDEFLFKYRDFGLSLSKINKKKVKRDAARIARSNVKAYKDMISERALSETRNNFSKREEEILAIALFVMLFSRDALVAFSCLRKLSKRSVVIGSLRFFTEIF